MGSNGLKQPGINVLFCGSTDVSRLNPVSSAGKDQNSTFITPAVDAEIILEGKTLSTNDPPMTPDGIPTPSIITRSALQLMDIPTMVVNAGLKYKPETPFFETGLRPALAGNIKTALPDVKQAIKCGVHLNRLLKDIHDPYMLSESVPGGTTTAQIAMSLWGKEFVSSSSMKINPTELKSKIVLDALSIHGVQSDPLKAITCGGDYMQALLLAFLSSKDDDHTVYLAGGTQMAVIWYMALELGFKMDNVYLCTTDLVMKGSGEQIRNIVSDDHILVSRLNYNLSTHKGIRLYAEDNVREGAGLGCSTYFAIQNFGMDKLMASVDQFYSTFIKH